jgi:phosphoglycerate kinase
MAFRTLDDLDVKGKRVLVRADLNVPMKDGKVSDTSRIDRQAPTIRELADKGAKVIVLSHFERPKGKVVPSMSLKPVAPALAEAVGRPVAFADDCVGDHARSAVAKLSDGDVLLLENTRFEPGETENDPKLAETLGTLADLYVNDAFGAAHRAHASTAGVAGLLPGFAGLLLEQEVTELTRVIESPARPLVVVLGGAKVTDKVGVIDRFLEIADEILIGGAMCFSFFRAQGIETGNSLVEEEGVKLAGDALERADSTDCDLSLPVDLVLGQSFDAATERRESDRVEVPDGWMGLDIGPRSAATYAEAIGDAGTVLWNGPMGAFEMEPFAAGTRTVAEAVAGAPGTTVIGGGDSVAALRQFGLADEVDWLSTGGGASLELLEGKKLPGVEALRDA